MKKFTLMLSAALVSLSVLAAPIERASLNTKKLTSPNAVERTTIRAEKRMDLQQVAEVKVSTARKAPKQKQEITNLVAKESGIGIFSFTYEGGTSTYLQATIYDSKGQKIAYASYSTATFKQYITSSYNILRYGTIVDETLVSDYTLQNGEYIIAIMGHDGSSITEDVVSTKVTLSMTEDTYAIVNPVAEVQGDGKTKISWSTNTTPIPEGWWYEVRISTPANGTVYDSYTVNDPAIGGFGTLTANTLTPDTIFEDGYYTIRISIWTEDGYRGGNAARCSMQIGENPNIPTNLKSTADDETMTADLSWEGTTSYFLISLTDSEGNEYGFASSGAYQFASGGWYVYGQAATTKPLPVGTYTWQITPALVISNTLYEASDPVEGPSFEIKDVTAPVIDSIFVANTEEAEVSLGIEVSDNAVNVTPADLVFDVTGDVTLAAAHLEADGTLKLTGLTAGTTYTIQVTATDPSGNKSTAYEFSFTAQADKIAPTNLKAELDSVSDKFVTINVEAEDNLATAEQLVYIFTFTDGTVIEKSASADGQITIDGLTPETEYEVTVTVRDFGGNVSAESVKLQFTTLELIPIEIYFDYLKIDKYASYDDEKGHNFTISLYTLNEAHTQLTYPFVQFDIYTEEPLTVTGVYNSDLNNLDVSYCKYVISSNERINMVNAQLLLKYLGNTTVEGTVSPIFYGEFTFLGSDGNLYVSAFRKNCYPSDGDAAEGEDDSITLTDEIADTDAPQLWVSEDYPVEVEGTNVEIMFGAYDGPLYEFLSWTDEPYSTVENLTISVTDENGNVLASSAAGSIVNTPTLDEDGAYFFTASLTNLESNTDYTVYIVATDEAGNVSEPLAVQFTTGQGQGIEDINAEVKTSKALRNGVLIIERNGKEYNATGKLMK